LPGKGKKVIRRKKPNPPEVNLAIAGGCQPLLLESLTCRERQRFGGHPVGPPEKHGKGEKHDREITWAVNAPPTKASATPPKC
jgi:hypothetical protein